MVAALLAVALLAYGIASEAVLFPYEEHKGMASVGRLVGRAYWEIHGTLNLAEMDGGAHYSTGRCLRRITGRRRNVASLKSLHYALVQNVRIHDS